MSKTTIAIMTMALVLTAGCASNGRKVIDHSDGDMPEWAKLNTEIKEGGGKMYVVGRTEMDGRDDINACLKSSIHDGRGSMAQNLSSKISALAESYLGKGGVEFNEVVKNQTEVGISDSKVEGQYWQKESRPVDENHREVKLQCFAKISIDSSQYRKILTNIEDKSKNSEIKKALEAEAKRFISGGTAKAAE